MPTLWLTGLPAAGKSTLAAAVARELARRSVRSCILDGDELRQGLSSDLGLSREDRAEQARRVAHVAAIVGRTGAVPIVALVSPYQADRDLARQIHLNAGLAFIEVWVDTPLEVCVQRDPKGLYKRAQAGSLANMTGFNAPYEIPAGPELRVDAAAIAPDATAEILVDRLLGASSASAKLAQNGTSSPT